MRKIGALVMLVLFALAVAFGATACGDPATDTGTTSTTVGGLHTGPSGLSHNHLQY